MLTHAMAHEGCTDTVRESALKVDPGRKIPCRTGVSSLRQRRAGPMLYQLELEFAAVTRCSVLAEEND